VPDFQARDVIRLGQLLVSKILPFANLLIAATLDGLSIGR
jgi:hypothetical protein